MFSHLDTDHVLISLHLSHPVVVSLPGVVLSCLSCFDLIDLCLLIGIDYAWLPSQVPISLRSHLQHISLIIFVW